jgi:hypothetical protein
MLRVICLANGAFNMNFFICLSEAEANAIDAQIVANVRAWAQANAPEVVSEDGYLRGRNAATGELAEAVTTRWDEPRILADGRFAILKPTAERVAPMPLADALAEVAASEITQAEYEAALPAPVMPMGGQE